jgi:sugar phosphate isomerase/epimerase
MQLSLAIQTPEVPVRVPVALLDGNLEENLIKVSSLGFDGIELITTNPAELNGNSIKKLLAQYHLQVSAIASGGLAFAAKLTLLNPDPNVEFMARQRLYDMIDFASNLGAPVVTVGSFRGRAVEDKSRSLQILADILRNAGERAVKLGVRIALEPLNHYEADLLHTAAQTLEYLQVVNHPAVGILLDTYHVNIEESSWTEPYLSVMDARKLFYVHLSDNNRLPPGKGLIDFPAILQTLIEGGYAGWLSAEVLPFPNPEIAVNDIANYMHVWLNNSI